jgi:hypothetical protein
LASLTLTFRNINRYSLIFTKISKEGQPNPHSGTTTGTASSAQRFPKKDSLTLTVRNSNRHSLIFTKISKEGKPNPHIQEHQQV